MAKKKALDSGCCYRHNEPYTLFNMEGDYTMPLLTCMVEGNGLPNAKEDFKEALRVEQYRISSRALYLPEGLRWKYIPLSEIEKAEESFRVISAGHCVPVREKRPEIDVFTSAGTVHISLEKQESLQKIMAYLDRKETEA